MCVAGDLKAPLCMTSINRRFALPNKQKTAKYTSLRYHPTMHRPKRKRARFFFCTITILLTGLWIFSEWRAVLCVSKDKLRVPFYFQQGLIHITFPLSNTGVYTLSGSHLDPGWQYTPFIFSPARTWMLEVQKYSGGLYVIIPIWIPLLLTGSLAFLSHYFTTRRIPPRLLHKMRLQSHRQP